MVEPDAHSNTLEFAGFTVDLLRSVIESDGAELRLRPKSFDVLCYLARNAGRTVSGRELLDAVWPDSVVTEDSVRQCINDVRKALQDKDQRIIRTVPRRGYVLDAPMLPPRGSSAKSRQESAGRGPRQARLAAGLAALVILASAAGWYGWMRNPAEAGAAGDPAPQRSIAVLRFTDMSPGQNESKLADGFSEEIMDSLSRSPSLLVIARTSAFAVQGRTVEEIASQLGVDYVLEGSIRRQGNEIRITAQLVDAATSAQVWSNTYDRRLDSFLSAQEDVARAVASALEVRLADAGNGYRPDPEAHAAYLEGRFFYYRRGAGDLAKARARYEAAVARDPRYAQAWNGLAAVARVQLDPSPDQVDDPRSRAELLELETQAVQQALRYGPDLVETRVRAINHALQLGEWDQAAEHIAVAFAIDPDHWLLRAFLATQYRLAGRIDDAVALIRQNVRRDPLNSIERGNLVSYLLDAGRVDEAESQLAALFALEPSLSEQNYLLAFQAKIRLLRNELDGITRDLQQLSDDAERKQLLAMAYAGLLDFPRTDALLRDQAATAHDPAGALRVAEVYAYRRMPNLALEWLAKAGDPLGCYDTPDASTVYYSPFLALMSGDARWDAWRHRMGNAMKACRLPVDPDALASDRAAAAGAPPS